MRRNNLYFYSYTANFKVPIETPLIHLEKRKVLIVEWVDIYGRSYFGECNAFETDWYHDETIASVVINLKKWFEKHQHDTFDNYESSVSKLNELDEYPNARSVLSMIFVQMFNELGEVKVSYGATVNGHLKEYVTRYAHTMPNRIKLKWNQHSKEDMKFLETQYPDVLRVIDANGKITESDISILNQFKSKQFIYIEQPFKDYETYLTLRNKLNVPVFIDESAVNVDTVNKFNTEQVIDGVVVKPSRVGGIDKAIEMINYCKQNELKVVIGGMYEFGLSAYFTAMLASYSDYPSDISPSDYYFDYDFIENPASIDQNNIMYTPPLVNKQKLKKYNKY